MAKGDFDIEEPDYYGDIDDTKEETNKKDDNSYQDYENDSNLSSIGMSKDLDYIDNANVVFEEKENQTPQEKLNYFLSTINKKVLFVILAEIIMIGVIVFIVFGYISKDRASYFSKVVTPEIVYMGETGNLEVVANGKKDLEKTTTTFTTKNTNIITLLNDKLTGKDVMNIIIPVQEGRAKIQINSKLGKKEMAKENKEVVICPAFNSSLLLAENISIVKGTTYNLSDVTDFGEKECGKDIVFESSDNKIIKVNNKGDIQGVNPGKAILTLKKGARSFSVNVEVTKEYVDMKSYTVTPNKLQLNPGDNTRLRINYTPSNATSSGIILVSSDETIAKISDGGLVTAVGTGTATITVRPINGGVSQEIKVIVSDKASSGNTEVTEMKLDKTSIVLTQGDSEKVMATVTPDNAKNKTITWTSSDESIATVTNKGVIFAKKEGTADITASTNNNISRTIKVTVTKMKAPVIEASDKIETNKWHNRPYSLNFSGSENGVIYHYGKQENKQENKGEKVTIAIDEKATYYVKACKNNVCSPVASYISKLDTTKPQVLTVAGISNVAVKQDSVQIALKDTTSWVQKWCVTTVDNASTCKWKTIKTMSNPVVTYTAQYNATYYAFAKDTAGNISNSYPFEIANIE